MGALWLGLPGGRLCGAGVALIVALATSMAPVRASSMARVSGWRALWRCICRGCAVPIP